MRKRIYKFGPFRHGYNLAYRGKPLHVAWQESLVFESGIYMWCEITDGATPDNREKGAWFIATGYQDYEDETSFYIGTVQDPHGMVWHIIGGK